MPMMSQTLGAVNPLLQQPDVALPILGGLLAAGAGLSLSHILKAAKVDMTTLSDEALEEADLLSKAAPRGFWHRVVRGITESVSRGPAEARWYRGIWDVRRPVADVGLVTWGATYDEQTTVVITPMLEGGILVPDEAEIARVLQHQSGSWVA